MTGLLRDSVFLHRTEVKSSYDVVIIGGGVNGLAIAHNLAANHGITNVAVFEKAYIGSGGSGRNTQVIRANYNTPENVPLYKASLGIWRTLSQELDFNILFTTQGELDLCHTVDALDTERDKSLLNRAYGVATDILTVDEVMKRCPLVDVTGGGELPVIGASYHPPGSFARHDSVVWGFAVAAQRRGVEIHEGVEVTGLDVRHGQIHGVLTDAGPTSANTVVSAAAGHSSVVAKMAGLRLPLATHPLQAFVTEPYSHVLDGLVSSMDLYIYVSQTARGELLAGAEILPYTTYSTRSTFDFLTEAAKRSIMILPFMAKARAMRQWAGLCDMSPDSSPLLGETEVRNFYLAAGMGTWGFKGSPIFGRTMAELIATGRTPQLIAPFAPDRFVRDRMVPDAASAEHIERSRHMGQNNYDAIVIGGGHNGLTAAAYLARAGLKTLVLERREIVGGACVTEEIAPGVRASTTSYIASMLRPEVIRDLKLGEHGLKMVACEPGLQSVFEDGTVIPWWTEHERTVAEWSRISKADAATFDRVDARLKHLASYLQGFFLEEPPDVNARGWAKVREGRRLLKRFRKIKGDEITDLVSFLTGSLGEFLDRNFESEYIKRMYLANNVYGMHSPPYRPGTSIGLLFHLLSGGDDDVQGFYGHVIGGMGSITQAMAAAARSYGADIRTNAPVAQILTTNGRATGVALVDGTELSAKTIVSNADPKRTFLHLMEPKDLPEEFRLSVEGIKMAGPCAKVNMVLSEEPAFTGMPADAHPNRRSLATLVPTLEAAERMYDIAKWGEIPEDLWVDCVVASNVDPTLAPEGKHVMTCFVQYVPYELREGTWDERSEAFGKRVVDKVGQYAPNVPGAVEAMKVVTPLDLERTYGLTEGNIFHGDLNIEQLFFMRPVPGWSNFRTPVQGLYLCGAGVHPGGGVTGAPGYGASHKVLGDLKRR